MADPLTEPFEPYQPEPAYDWEYDEEPRSRKRPMPNILWGRVAILGALILFAFLLGRMTGSSGVPAADLEVANDEITSLEGDLSDAQDQITALETQVTELQAADTTTDTTTDDGTTDTTDDGTSGDAAAQTYTVKSGDTLSIIAEKFYGDASLDDFLAEANGIADPTQISVGQEITIPEEPAE
ncbi:MAG: LysM peptidoglycan-binding domain-containing protein [Actinomycetota bacterium]